MIATNYSNVRNNLAHYCNKAVQDFETVVITRKNDENVVLMSEAEYNNLMENLFVRRNPDEYKALVETIRKYEAGKAKVVKRTLDQLEGDE
ncbi:MAG: type II toxin-antitoxin system prevent-host-death family antitoxin [Clostridiales Family XIII bacterium]|jgi:antitoxin YefM|nr:type II toxin-antitoxin system prevent-host-death family antitoxin [Clostridiales Family XIII bacterium]